MEVRVELTESIQDAASKAGLEPEAWLKRAAFRQALYEKDPDSAPDIIAGLDAAEAGEFATDEEVEAVFAKYRVKHNG